MRHVPPAFLPLVPLPAVLDVLDVSPAAPEPAAVVQDRTAADPKIRRAIRIAAKRAWLDG
jgi:hypothetical protein